MFFIYLIIGLINSINSTYPHPMLGIEAYTWLDDFRIYLMLSLMIFGIPLLIDILLLILSIIKLKKLVKDS